MKSVLISGSSRGLGKQLATILSDRNFKVYRMGNLTPSLTDVVVDLIDEKATKIAINRYLENKEPIDILVCNAGTGKKPVSSNYSLNQKEYFYEKNFLTAKNLINATIGYMKPGSSVIGISSIVALKSIEGAPEGYAESKKQFNELFRKYALDYAKSEVRFNVISPGNVYFEKSRWSEIQEANPNFVKDLLDNQVPLGRFISPLEIAEAIIYLSSHDARNITGANLVIDGGQSL